MYIFYSAPLQRGRESEEMGNSERVGVLVEGWSWQLAVHLADVQYSMKFIIRMSYMPHDVIHV